MKNLLRKTSTALLILLSLGIQSVYADHEDGNGRYDGSDGRKGRDER